MICAVISFSAHFTLDFHKCVKFSLRLEYDEGKTKGSLLWHHVEGKVLVLIMRLKKKVQKRLKESRSLGIFKKLPR